ncbi:diacylglycerol kinase [Moritella viscosa]|uniref:Diacylglycerol kinase n=1 Tax=Moritella viscosa TaxID=80854 RepID=A0A090IMX7_9GAMM|nr:diacylglycerol kinase [Moritella viscosa]CED61854.1 diacylglycerol kinase [Moritella viscosa]SGY91105.1 Diacylglycerol kinase [Moritella viscosa]SGY95377.1 Diacylglycerol kinase [Moritella viscosa]SGY95779.1 Diacylglycerol kinase [Moritella viscosa]SGZ00383.1 Diacylglycerol kinase [Moritella viscosa]
MNQTDVISNAGKPGYTGLTRIIKATGYSWQGLRAAFKYESAIRQELLLLIIFTPIALLLDITNIEKILLVASLVLVLIVELLNSAIEAIVDRIGTEHHELSGRAKDIGSAAVFVTLCLAVFTWFMIVML